MLFLKGQTQYNLKKIHASKNNALYLGVKVFSTKVLIEENNFTSHSAWRRDYHFAWSTVSREGLAN